MFGWRKNKMSAGEAVTVAVSRAYERGFREGVESAFQDLKPFLTQEQQRQIVEWYKNKLTTTSK